MPDVRWLDPRSIEFKISPVCDLTGIVGGSWDIERRFALRSTSKYRSVMQRFAEGRPWEETDLFRDLYRRRFAAGETVRGAATLAELAAQYYDRVDGLHRDMGVRGFRAVDDDDGHIRLPHALIGRDGAVFIGNQGNHRLAIAHHLRLERIAVAVVCIHSEHR